MNRSSRIALAATAVVALGGTIVPLAAFASGGSSVAAACPSQSAAVSRVATQVSHDRAALAAAKAKKHKLRASAVAKATARLAADEGALATAQSALITCQGEVPVPTTTVTATPTAAATVTATATATTTTTTTVTVTAPPVTGPVTLAVVGDTACEPDDTENAVNPTAIKCDGAGIGENQPTSSATPSPSTSATNGMDSAYKTVDEIEAMKPQALALLGDEQYQVGKLSDFEQSFDKTYGALKWLIKPAPGNHEFYSYTKNGDNEAAQNGAGYFSYFNGTDATGAIRPDGQAGTDTAANQGWYSYDLGNWHIISLNAECGSTAFGGNGSKAAAANCDPAATTATLAKTETDWLASDLADDTAKCTIAYWHQPTFTASASGSVEGSTLGEAWWKLLYAHGHAIVLNGHEHLYARFNPMDPAGAADPKGIPEFIVGTGGEALDALAPAASDLNTVSGHNDGATLATGQAQAFGAMKMTLNPDGSYAWDYEPSVAQQGQPASALTYSDKGSATC